MAARIISSSSSDRMYPAISRSCSSATSLASLLVYSRASRSSRKTRSRLDLGAVVEVTLGSNQ